MALKHWPYWLKGGIIALAVGIMWHLTGLGLTSFCGYTFAGGGPSIPGICGNDVLVIIWSMLFFLPHILILIPVSVLSFFLNETAFLIFAAVYLLSFDFAIGALIGFIIQKIKSK